MLGDGTCRNVECISNLHPAYEDHKKRTISHTWNRSRKDCGCAFVFCKSLGTVITVSYTHLDVYKRQGVDPQQEFSIKRQYSQLFYQQSTGDAGRTGRDQPGSQTTVSYTHLTAISTA